MKLSLILRSASLTALLAAALSAHADDAYSNFSVPYDRGFDNVYGSIPRGARFESQTTGILAGFTLPINNNDQQRTGQLPFTLELFAVDSQNLLGNLLGTYAGTSTGIFNPNSNFTPNSVTVVPASGPSVTLVAGTSYWIRAVVPPSATYGLVWNWVAAINDPFLGPRYPQQYKTYSYQGQNYYEESQAPAFSVQVTPVPEPATLAALGLGVVGVIRRSRRNGR